MTKNNCNWHRNEESIEDNQTVGCPECGRLIATTTCPKCGKEFLNWDHRGCDDIIAGPAVTSFGDFCCTACLSRLERENEEIDEDYYDYYRPII